jgi:uncharacterized protein
MRQRLGLNFQARNVDSEYMDSIPQRVLLTGASGMLGSALRRALMQRSARLLQLVRREPAADNQLRWDPALTPPVSDSSPLEGCTTAIHLSGASVAGRRWTPAYKRELFSSRVDSTHALATLLAGLRQRPKALLVASAIGFYGDRGDQLLDEASPAGRGFMPDVCREWEAAAQPAIKAGMRVVHLRFGVVLGPREGALAQMLPPFRLGLGGKLGSGRQWMSWIGLADAVSAILFAVDTPSLSGPLNLTAPNPVTNAEFTRALATQLHRPAVLTVPKFALRFAFGEMANEPLLASARVHPRKLQNAGFAFSQPTLSAALAAALPRKP